MESILGLLRIRVKRGINLAVRDVRSSDPYVVIRMGNQVGFSFFFFFLISLAVLCSFFLFFLRLFFAFFWCCFFSEIGKFRNKKELVNLGLYFLIQILNSFKENPKNFKSQVFLRCFDLICLNVSLVEKVSFQVYDVLMPSTKLQLIVVIN